MPAPFELRALPLLLRQLPPVAPLPDDAGEHVVSQLDARGPVPFLQPDQAGSDEPGELVLGQAVGHGVVPGDDVPEALLGDQLVLDEAGDAVGQAADARRVVVVEHVALGTSMSCSSNRG